jgi:membrane-associated phospholipid phosphatase
MPQKNIKRYFCVFLCLVSVSVYVFSETDETTEDYSPSVPSVFYHMGFNFLHSFAHNYGLTFVAAGLGTWGLIETGAHWHWRNITYENDWLVKTGIPLLAAGYFIPAITPLTLYITGRFTEDIKLQTTASALTQALILTLAVQTPLKMITGREPPDVISEIWFEPQTRNDSTDDFSGKFNWFNMNANDGWPSGHTATAFSAAAVIAEIYHDKPWLKAGVYTYAALMGFSVAANVHWVSEFFAGALIGYAIGKTVGKSYRRYLEKNTAADTVSLYFSHNSIGVIIRM